MTGHGHVGRFARLATACVFSLAVSTAVAETRASPPTVGTMKVSTQGVTETEKFIGRIQSVYRYSAVARVTAFLEQVVFTEGQDVKKGDVLYQLEKTPFEADLESKKGAVANFEAQLRGADLALGRSSALLRTASGLQQKVDEDQAQQGSLQGQLQSARADLKTSETNLGYTTITSPIDGKVGRTAVTVGNLVSPETGVLTTVVSQDPMYVVFTIPTRTVIDLRYHLAGSGGLDSVKLRLILPDGRRYDGGRVDFTDNTVSSSTDSFTVRGVFANPAIGMNKAGRAARELIDGEFVTVILEDPKPVALVTIPRSAVLTDQRGDYVYVVGDDLKAIRQNIELGPMLGTRTAVKAGLSDGQMIVVDNLQRVRVGEPVAPVPADRGPAESTGEMTR